MRKRIINVLVLFVMFCSQVLLAQNISDIATVKVDKLSDEQIEMFWQKVKQQGYGWNQVEALVKSKGMPFYEVEKLRERIRKLQLNKDKGDKFGKEKDTLTSEEIILFGLTGKEKKPLDEKKKEVKKDSLFGYDFFNNPRITFTPNINVATPQNYQLGPGDEVQIDLWGAAETSFKEKVSKQGTIQIRGVGLVNLAGLSIETATSKIKSYLRRIYSGINAPKNSYNKVYVNVSLSKIRTVQVNLVGEVKTPGTYSLSALSTVLNALYAAGGPTKSGTFRKISLIRGGKKVADFDIYQYLLKGNEEGNLQLKDQDVIIVSPYKNLVTITGEVKRPGIYEMVDDETMSKLLDYCGGFTAQAYKKTIVVERISSAEREIKEFLLSESNVIKSRGGDKIAVPKVVDKYENRVKIKGAVYQPGSYQYKKGMTVLDLLKKASGVTKEAFMDRAIITRFYNELDKGMVAFSVSDVYNNKNNTLLQPNDEVYVYNKEELREKRIITVNGAVNDPKSIDFAKGMTAEDAIVLAGGLKEGADTSNIEVSRRLNDGSFEVIGQVFTRSSDKNLKVQSNNNFALKPYDIVYVRYIKGYTPQKKVIVKGEVEYPGEYSITTKNERISDLIKRAGGLSPFAYAEGATLIRKKIGEVDDKQEKFLKKIKNKGVENQDEDSQKSKNEKLKSIKGFTENDFLELNRIQKKEEFRIGISLHKILKNKGSEFDLILQEGDELLIPTEKQTVEVQGEVYSPSLVRFIPGKSLKYYVESAGGFSQEAQKKKSYVVYSNGSVDATTGFLFFKNYPSIKPGATIIVPKKDQSRKVSAQEIIGITTGIATLGVLIDRLIK